MDLIKEATEKFHLFLSRYSKPAQIPTLTCLTAPEKEQTVIFRALPFFGICAHHFLPIRGFVTIAFTPGPFIVGLSSFKRLVEALSQEPMMQEAFMEKLLDEIETQLSPKGVAIQIKATHTCSQASLGEWQELETFGYRGSYTNPGKKFYF
jgi:GTP cyclohydrolase I